MDLQPILDDLRLREPIFHTPLTADFDRLMATDYTEVGASDHTLRTIAPDIYLLTYTLLQNDRLTRRATLWQQTSTGWQILYHQGTLVAATPDDITSES